MICLYKLTFRTRIFVFVLFLFGTVFRVTKFDGKAFQYMSYNQVGSMTVVRKHIALYLTENAGATQDDKN